MSTPVTPGGGVWAEMAGQTRAIASFSKAARAARALLRATTQAFTDSTEPPTATLSTDKTATLDRGGTADLDRGETADLEPGTLPPENSENLAAMTHSWLIVGPAGSGRSTAAKAFAAALECVNPAEAGCGSPDCPGCSMVRAGVHPDVTVVSTDLVQITAQEVKELVQQAYVRPSVGAWRVIIVEDYDRMSEASSNILLKVLEEPPPRTVWLLCAPSVTDVIPTVRSRCRQVHLSMPGRQAVAELLVRRDGVDPLLAAQVAAEADCHVGRARALAKNPQLRQRRAQMLELVSQMRDSSQACWTAAALVRLVGIEAAERAGDSEEVARQQLFTQFGMSEDLPESQWPKALKKALKDLEANAKRRARRQDFDVWDRVLEDLAGFYRDAMMLQLHSHSPLLNESLRPEIEGVAQLEQCRTTQGQRRAVAKNISRLEAIRVARQRLQRNAAPALTAEALCIELL